MTYLILQENLEKQMARGQSLVRRAEDADMGHYSYDKVRVKEATRLVSSLARMRCKFSFCLYDGELLFTLLNGFMGALF